MLPADVQYMVDVENGGLAKAYNYSLGIAQEEGFDWLLTLDQDSTLPSDFLCKLTHTLGFVAPLNTVAAVVPSVSAAGRIMSPWVEREYWARPKYLPDGFIGIPAEKVYALNSASTYRVGALKAVGGYDPRFYIWNSDLVIYHRLHCGNFKVFVAGNIHVDHVLSGFDLKRLSTPERYEEMLRAQEAFCDEYRGWLTHVWLMLMMFRLLVYRLWTTGGSFPFFRIVLRFLCRRLFYSRRHRLKSWEQSAKQRLRVTPLLSRTDSSPW